MSIIKFEPNEFGLNELEAVILGDWMMKPDEDGKPDYTFAATLIEGDKSYPIKCGEIVVRKDVGEYALFLTYQDGWIPLKHGGRVPDTHTRYISIPELDSYTWDDEKLILEHKI